MYPISWICQLCLVTSYKPDLTSKIIYQWLQNSFWNLPFQNLLQKKALCDVPFFNGQQIPMLVIPIRHVGIYPSSMSFIQSLRYCKRSCVAWLGWGDHLILCWYWSIRYWLVVYLTLWKIWVGILKFHISGNIWKYLENKEFVPNHKPGYNH